MEFFFFQKKAEELFFRIKKQKPLYLKRQLRVLVQVLHHRLGQLRVLPQLLGVHAEAHHPVRFVIFRVVRDPAAAEVEDGRVGRAACRESFGVKLGEGCDGGVVDVGDEAGDVVEEGVVGPRREKGEEMREER